MSKFTPARAWRLVRSTEMSNSVPNFSTDAEAFAAAITSTRRAGAALVTRRVGNELRHYVATSHKGADAAAANLAKAVGATAQEVRVSSDPQDASDRDALAPMTGVVSVARVIGNGVEGRSSLNGVDPSMVSDILDNNLADGEEVVVTLVSTPRRVRRTWSEYAENLPGESTHHTLKTTNKLIASVMVRAGSDDRADELVSILMNSLPGWDTAVEGSTGWRWPWVKYLFALAGLAAVVHSLVTTGEVSVPAMVIAGFCALAFLYRLTPTQEQRMAAALDRGAYPTGVVGRSLGQDIRSFLASRMLNRVTWPLGRTVVPTSAPVVVPLVAPQSGASSGATSTRERKTPPELIGVDGPPVFHVGSEIVRLDWAALWSGVMTLGKAGSGKSVVNQSLFGWLVRRKALGSLRCAVLAVETKPDGVDNYETMARAAGINPVVIEVARPSESAHRLDMFARKGDDFLSRAAFIADTWAASFSDGAIQGRSREAIVMTVAAGLLFDEAAFAEYEAARVRTGGDRLRRHSWFEVASALVGNGYGEETGRTLIAVLSQMAHGQKVGGVDVHPARQADAARSLAMLEPMWGAKVTASARRNLNEAARNKFAFLEPAVDFIAPGGGYVYDDPSGGANTCFANSQGFSYDEFLIRDGVLVIGTGPSRSGTQIPHGVTAVVTAMLGFTAQAAVARTCFGWQSQGRNIAVMCDEFKHFAGYNEEVARWWRDDGRSYGVLAIFATQYPEQIRAVSVTLLKSVMSYGTIITFSHEDAETAELLAERASRGDEGKWNAADIINLPRFTAVVVTRDGKDRALPAFTAAAVHSTGDPAAYIETCDRKAA